MLDAFLLRVVEFSVFSVRDKHETVANYGNYRVNPAGIVSFQTFYYTTFFQKFNPYLLNRNYYYNITRADL